MDRDDLWPLGLAAGVSCAVIVHQKDLGTAAVVAVTMMGLLWVAGIRLRHLALLAGAGVAAVAAAILLEPYRMQRFMAFLDPSADPLKSGYQVRQALLALGRGGLFGVGAGNSVQKFSYLPEAHTDMIFAVLGEEFGLIGVGVVVGLFTLFALSAFQLARRCTRSLRPLPGRRVRLPHLRPSAHQHGRRHGSTTPYRGTLTVHQLWAQQPVGDDDGGRRHHVGGSVGPGGGAVCRRRLGFEYRIGVG